MTRTISRQRWIPLRELSQKCCAPAQKTRLRALQIMREQLEWRRVNSYFELAKRMLSDDAQDYRWQAAIVIARFIDTMPEQVWLVVERQCNSADDDLKDALATVLLEHLLEKDFDTYFSRLKKAVSAENNALLDVLSRCWPFETTEKKWDRVQTLLTEHGIHVAPPWDACRLDARSTTTHSRPSRK